MSILLSPGLPPLPDLSAGQGNMSAAILGVGPIGTALRVVLVSSQGELHSVPVLAAVRVDSPLRWGVGREGVRTDWQMGLKAGTPNKLGL